MFLKYLYITWTYLLRILGIALLGITIVLLGLFGTLQLPVVQHRMADYMAQYFNDTYNGTLQVGSVRGLIPFNMQLQDVVLTSSHNELTEDTLVTVDRVDIRLKPVDLLRNSLSVQSMIIARPRVRLTLEEDGSHYHIERAFQRIEASNGGRPPNLENLELFAPLLAVSDGELTIEQRQPGIQASLREPPLFITDIQLSAFAEISELQRYASLEFLYARVPQWSSQSFRIRGQLFNDNRFLELNGFRIEHAENLLSITGEAENVDLFEPDLSGQFRSANFQLSVDTLYVSPEDLRVYDIPLFDTQKALAARFYAQGSLDTLNIINSEASFGRSRVGFSGELMGIGSEELFSYDGNLRGVNLDHEDWGWVHPAINDMPFTDWNTITLSGRLFGNLRRTDAMLQVSTNDGRAAISGDIQWERGPDYQFQIETESLNTGQFVSLNLPESNLNATVTLKGIGLGGSEASIRTTLALVDSRVGSYEIDEVSAEGAFANKRAEVTLSWLQDRSLVNATMLYQQAEQSEIQIQGSADNLNLTDILPIDGLAPTNLQATYEVQLNGTNIEDMLGILTVDINTGTIDGNPVQSHQLYADLVENPAGDRTLRLTSTLADAELSGDLYPKQITQLASYWGEYLVGRVENELVFTQEEEWDDEADLSLESLDIQLQGTFKNTDLLKQYWPSSPFSNAEADFQAQVSAGPSRLLINAGSDITQIGFNDWSVRNASALFSTSLQYGRRLQDFSTLNLVVRAQDLSKGRLNASDLDMSLSLLNETGQVSLSTGQIGTEGFTVEMELGALLDEGAIQVQMQNFELGLQNYAWTLQNAAQVRFTDDRRLRIDDFTLISAEQRIEVEGTYSASLDDAMRYRFVNVNLADVSTLIDGRVGFDGILDGEFTSQSLLREPAIAGNLFIDRLRVDNRLVGDVSFDSRFDSEDDRFNTQIRVLTDSVKYSSYLEDNENRGTDVLIKGWVRAPDQDTTPADTLYYFDADLREIDGWILQPILPFIFTESEGLARGAGYITGTGEDFYFHADFDIEELFGIPQFTFVPYWLSGNVVMDRYDGVRINNVQVRDRNNGTGVLAGTIGFNDFQEERPFDLTLELDRLQFLNNTFDEETAFYGSVAGTGIVALSGSNMAPFLRTVVPVTTTADSRLTIPLLEETTVEEQARFIEFVQSFEELYMPVTDEQTDLTRELLRQMTFVEIARLDLQFIAPPQTTVQLLFDPLTGEILNARGSGRIRITLEDEEFQMFGNFNVTSGDYTFVAGDIFLRRFQLRDGGIIRWEGDPANAQLNMTAAYRARPDIGVLTGGIIDQQSRIPIDLILEITGTIQSIENNYFFEFPNAVDLTQNATELALLNSEDQKLLQATSLLFTGGFIPIGTGGDEQFAELGTSLQSRAGQVGLSQLLSNQINTLLNSNLSNLDVDLNLTGFDQADLGIALRLFDDRLILRGESQFYTAAETGAETTLGDLGVTYRISRNLSVEVFHRRDPTLRSIVGNQTQAESINGVGLEAQVQFNTWKELRQRWWGQIRRFFGLAQQGESAEIQTAVF
ncbi:MAG: hypothetical protein HLUCCA01_01780 [Bacteroidetes bacterium HLUCCA01]|nr:MAG: hypothetical protein HLUCCA01_01780 [Bacteroidetes bacterium HLUCCA01]